MNFISEFLKAFPVIKLMLCEKYVKMCFILWHLCMYNKFYTIKQLSMLKSFRLPPKFMTLL